MKNQITKEQLKQLIDYRLESIGLKEYSDDITEVNDSIIRWYCTVYKRINN